MMTSVMVKQRVKQTFTCKYCHSVLTSENRFLNHNCTRMKRAAEAKTVKGQAAFSYFYTWMRSKNKYVPSNDTFLNSNYFRTFISFVDFVNATELPFPDKFIWFMNKKNFPPSLWMNDEVYSMYIDFIDLNVDPIDQVELSIKTLYKYSTKKDIDISEVFNVLNPNELLHLLRVRKVSPYLLLASKTFAEMIKTRMNVEQQNILESYIKSDIWGNKLSSLSIENKTKIKDWIKELNI